MTSEPSGVIRVHRILSIVIFTLLASLDNVAIGLAPVLIGRIGVDLRVGEGAVGSAVAASYLLSAVASVAWGYTGDRTDRKRLLLAGTLIWAAGTAITAISGTFWVFFAAQLAGALGLGAVGSIGFSVVSDLVSPRWRALVLSLWGLSQGAGALVGTLLAGLAGGQDWRRPYWIITGAGLLAAVAYLGTADIRRGQSDPELAEVFAEGRQYPHRIGRGDLPAILARRTNLWLVLQGLTAQITFGSLVWIPRLVQERARGQGYSESVSVAIGSVFAAIFQLGVVFAVLGGFIGDRLARRTPLGRGLVAAVGVLASIPFYIAVFFLPIRIRVPENSGGLHLVSAILLSIFREPTVALGLLLSTIAAALISANSPNWFALIVDVNPPEHRGTVYSMGNLVNGVGRAVGTATVGGVLAMLAGRFPPPTNYAVGLAAFQVFLIPTGVMYLLAARRTGTDTAQVRAMLRARADAVVSRRGDADQADTGRPPSDRRPGGCW